MQAIFILSQANVLAYALLAAEHAQAVLDKQTVVNT